MFVDRYQVMLHCWDADSHHRPDFRQLTDIFETMITADVEYLDVRSLIVTNKTYFGGDLVPAPCQFREGNTWDQGHLDALVLDSAEGWKNPSY